VPATSIIDARIADSQLKDDHEKRLDGLGPEGLESGSASTFVQRNEPKRDEWPVMATLFLFSLRRMPSYEGNSICPSVIASAMLAATCDTAKARMLAKSIDVRPADKRWSTNAVRC
jgi:hypothetical protein